MSTSRGPDDAIDEPIAADFPAATYADWESLVRAKEGDPDRALTTSLEDGLTVKWLYSRDDELGPDPAGAPGRDPFVRGTRTGPWAIRQQNGAPTRRQANAQILEDLVGGATEVLLFTSLDGTAGIPVGSVDELAEVLDGVHLDLAPVALGAGADADTIADFLLDLWRRSGHPAEELAGSLRLDPIGTLALAGETDAAEFAARIAAGAGRVRPVRDEFPRVRVLAADATPYVEAGAGAELELAVVIATAVAYLRAGAAEGIDPAELAAAIEFTFVAGTDQFLEIAKLRAARRMWETVLSRCGVDPPGRHSATYVRTSERMVSALDPWVNLLRGTIAAFSAAVAGADGITVLPFDAPKTGEPGPLGRRMARNTQLVLLEEASLHRVADPGAGSWYVESLSDELARAAWAEFQEIERAGGVVAALTAGTIRDRIAQETEARHDAFARRGRALTGVNMFPLLGDDGLEAVEREESGDDELELDTSLQDARPEAPVAAEPGHGLTPVRDAAGFEALRARAERLGTPELVLVDVGPLSAHVSVDLWAKSFFETGGVRTLSQPEDAIDLGGRTVAAVCAGRDADPADAVTRVREAGAGYVYLVGADDEAAASAGADAGVKDGVDMLAVLGSLLDRFADASDGSADADAGE